MKKKKKKKNSHPPNNGLVHRFLDSAVRLSLCMIVKNEEQNLPLCIAPLRPVLDEIVVVDTGSTDRTKEIARELGARVFDFPWVDDFSAARNESIRRATGNYILWLDGDDRVDESEVHKLARLKSMLSPRKDKGYYLYVNSQSPIDGETQFCQLRIFPRVPGAKFRGRVHEQIFHRLTRLGIPLIQADIVIRHTGYPTKATVVQKSERNLRLILKEIEADPDDPIWHYNAARTLAGIHRQAEAIVHLRKVLENAKIKEKEKQFYFETNLLLGRYYTELQELDEAYRVFSELVENFGGNGLAHFCLGENFFLRKDFEKARPELERSLMLPLQVGMFPVNLGKLKFYQYFMLGECFLEKGRKEPAKEMFQKSLNLHKDHYKSLQSLGLMSLREGKFEEAVAYFEKSIREGGKSDCNYANLGLAYKKIGRRMEAEKALLLALEINPQKIEALVNLGHLYNGMKNAQAAVAKFEEALRISPDLIDVRLALSFLFFRLREPDKLVGQCDTLLAGLNLPRNFIINSFKDLSILYAMIGEGLEKQGHKELSLVAYRLSFSISPSQEILERGASLAKSSGVLVGYLEEMQEVLKPAGTQIP
jgi:tetratricopeptide (TPR) repeat protein